jgi:predicted dehydrogenase
VGDALRYGIVGTGMMGLEHLLNLRLLDGARVVAIADPHEPSRARGRELAGPEARVFEDAREMLERAEMDAVVIATPNHTHAGVLDAVWGRPLHLLVEKPLCTTLEDCRRVEAAAASHPGLVWVGMEYRYMPPVARMIQELRAGAAGRLRMLAIREHRLPFLPKVGDWNRFKRNTGGTLVEKCCHFFDLMNLIVGERPLRVYASGAQDVNHLDESYGGEVPDILDNAYAIVDFAGGARALLDLCMFAEGAHDHNELCATGDRGQVRCAIPEGDVVISPRSRRGGARVHVPVEERILAAGFHHGATYFQHVAFAEAIRAGGAPAVSVRDGLLAVAMGLAAQRSIEERRPVELAELGIEP